MRNQQALHRAQLRRDYSEPPSFYDCEEEGHRWRYIRSNGEVTLYRCQDCGKEEVV